MVKKSFNAIFATSLILLTVNPSLKSQQSSSYVYMDYGKIYYDPADSLPVPTTLQQLIADFPEHDHISFRLIHAGKGEDCMNDHVSDELGRCFSDLMRHPKFRDLIVITNCSYDFKGEKNDMADLYLIMDDRFRLREWKNH